MVEAYDVIVVIGVLEYVGNGTADRKPYLDFLAGIRDRLVPGGTLVLAIENELGVKYVVGSPEDHTNRVFDSIEGYPRGGKARTFSRRALEQLMLDSGLTPATRIAFPDYKLTRVVFGDMPDAARSLLHRIPRFPSPDWRTARPRLADEHAVWRRLVEAGLEAEFGNSFLVLAGKGGPSELWPAGQAGAFYTSDRVKHLNTATVVQRSGDSVVFKRTSDGSSAGHSDVRVRRFRDRVRGRHRSDRGRRRAGCRRVRDVRAALARPAGPGDQGRRRVGDRRRAAQPDRH